MLRTLALLLLMPTAAFAQDVLAEYATDSGSLPPEYAWETSVTILTDGQLTLKHCKGYEETGPACKTRRAKVAEPALAAIRTAATESGLAQKPARENEMPTVGGGSTSGAVYLDGEKILLLSQPAEADADRVAKVLAAIAAAIPARFDRFVDPD
ncbi:MAG TPA: hypothetical protein VI412_06395 [Tabrizicola sp.]